MEYIPDPAFSVNETILGRPRVDFIHHAADRMRERGVTKEQVIDAIRSPDEDGLPVDGAFLSETCPRFRVRKLLGGGKALDVVYEVWPEAVVVVSVYPRRQRLGGRF